MQPGLPVVGGLAVALLFGKAMVGPLFAQTAWTNVTFIGSEVREPGRNLSRALLYGCGIVVVLYVLANVAYIASLPLTEIQNAPQNRVAVAMMRAIFGTPGVLAMAAAIMISTFGCNNGLILAGARVYYAMARDNLFFHKVGTTNRFHVPAFALLVQAIWTAFLTLPRTVTTNAQTGAATFGNVYTQLLEYIVSADLIFTCSLSRRSSSCGEKAGGRAPVSHLGLSLCSDYFDCFGSDCNSRPGFSSPEDIRNRNSDRPHRRAGLFLWRQQAASSR